MATIVPAMQLYHLTLQQSTHITCAVTGNFSKPRAQEIVVVRGSGRVLQLLRLITDNDESRLETVCSSDVFGVIRTVTAFRLVGGNRDYVIVGSDSGRINILQFNAERNAFVKIHEETFGKSGCRRTVPGEYLATDPKGRAVMIAAVEKQKFVYILNRDSTAQLTISSPLEAHKSNTVVFATVGLDVGYDSPLFACIESDYTQQQQQKQLTYYELDLGLNNVTRKHSERIDISAHQLIAVPGGSDSTTAVTATAAANNSGGPGGVIVCCQGYLLYKNLEDHRNTNNNTQIKCLMPQRVGLDVVGNNHPASSSNNSNYSNSKDIANGVLITCVATHTQKGLFFFLLQTEHGDLLKLTLTTATAAVAATATAAAVAIGGVLAMHCSYFDTVPVATAMCILKSGFLFVAAESGDHLLLQFLSIGDDDNADTDASNDNYGVAVIAHSNSSSSSNSKPPCFTMRAFKNMQLIDEFVSLSPLLHTQVSTDSSSSSNSNSSNSLLPRHKTKNTSSDMKLYAASGRASRASLSVLRVGVAVVDVATTQLPVAATAVYVLRQQQQLYIVISFVNATLVLLCDSSDNDTVTETTNTGIDTAAATLGCVVLCNNSIVQVHRYGLRVIAASNSSEQQQQHHSIQQWSVPSANNNSSGKSNSDVLCCAYNDTQVVLGLSGGVVVLFALNSSSNQLVEVARRDLGVDIQSVAIASNNNNSSNNGSNNINARAAYIAVGLLDNTVRILAADERSSHHNSVTGDSSAVLQQVALQVVDDLCVSLLFCYHAQQLSANQPQQQSQQPTQSQQNLADRQQQQQQMLCLYAGLVTGVLVRCVVVDTTGAVTDVRRRLLPASSSAVSSNKGVQLFGVTVAGVPAVAAVCNSRCFLSYTATNSNNHNIVFMPIVAVDDKSNNFGAVAAFSSTQCADGLVVITDNILRIVAYNNSSSSSNNNSNHSLFSSQQKLRLRYTPRKLCVVDNSSSNKHNKKLIVVIETDCNAYNASTKTLLESGLDSSSSNSMQSEDEPQKQELYVGQPHAGPNKWASCVRVVIDATADSSDDAADAAAVELDAAGDASGGLKTVCLIELSNQEAAFSMTTVSLAGNSNITASNSNSSSTEVFLAIGTVTSLVYTPRSFTSAAIRLYRFVSNNAHGSDGSQPQQQQQNMLELVHVTTIDDIPTAMVGFTIATPQHQHQQQVQQQMQQHQYMQQQQQQQLPLPILTMPQLPIQMLLVGVGSRLCLYVLGVKQLLKKVESASALFSSPIMNIVLEEEAAPAVDAAAAAAGEPQLPQFVPPPVVTRIYVTTVDSSVTVVLYHHLNRSFSIASDSHITRHVTCLCVLDSDTVMLADKFANIVVTRVAHELRDELARENSSNSASGGSSSRSSSKCNEIVSFFVGETVTSLHKVVASGTTNSSGNESDSECVLYSTIHGGIGVLLPVTSKHDVDLLTLLELQLRAVLVQLVGRDHLAYRSYYAPVKGVTDGDFIELFITELTHAQQSVIAEELVSTPAELIKKIQQFRARVM